MRGVHAVRFGVAACLLSLAVGVFAFEAASNYHLIKKIPLGAVAGGREYFDYVTFDPSSRRVYISRGSAIEVLNADTGAILGKITGLKRDHGVAVVPDLGRGFISDGEAAEVVIFDLKTLGILGRVKAAPDADGILYDPASKHVFVFEGDSNSCTVIDPAKGTAIRTVELGGAPEQAVADEKGMIYNNLEDKDQVIAIDSRTLAIKARWPVAPAGRPVAIAMDREHRRLFISGRNPKMMVVMNADNGKIIGRGFPIGDHVDTNIFDPGTRLAASSTGEGTIDIIHEDSPDKFSFAQSVKTEYGAKTMALDPKTHNLYVDTADFVRSNAVSGKKKGPQLVAKPGTLHLLVYGLSR